MLCCCLLLTGVGTSAYASHWTYGDYMDAIDAHWECDICSESSESESVTVYLV